MIPLVKRSRGDFTGDFWSAAVHAGLQVLLQQGVSSTDPSNQGSGKNFMGVISFIPKR